MKNSPVALVTGASSGIGASCAALLAAEGYRVYGASRSAVAVDPRITALRMDVTSDESVRAGCKSLLQREARIDVLVNSAGMGIAGAIEDTSPDEARQQLEVNVLGVLRVCRAILPEMRKQKSGCIVNIGSIAGLIAIPYQGMYSASKFALEGLTECLRMELKAFGVRVVLVEPGDHRTGFTNNRRFTAGTFENIAYRTACEQAVAKMAAEERAGPEPESIARLVYRIIRKRQPRLRYITGPTAQRFAAWLKRYGPNVLMERIIKGHYAR